MQLRGYQKRITNQIGTQNGIILLPTGSGKTLIGSEILKRFVCNLSPDQKLSALFFVPSRVLVVQQAQAIKQWTHVQVAEYMGGISFPTQFDILVSTPQAFLSVQYKSDKLQWSKIGLIIFDEVHHVLKDHPYRKIAHQIPQNIQIIGLTASLSYGVTEQAVNKTITRLMYELRLKVLATATKKELQQDGYHASALKTDKQMSKHEMYGTIPLHERKPHLMFDMFWNRCKKNQLTSHAKYMVDIVSLLEQKVQLYFPEFQSPLKQKKLSSWGCYAHSKKLYFLEHWYEALRIIVMNWEESVGLELAVVYLKMMKIDKFEQTGCIILDNVIIGKINTFFDKYGQFYPKIMSLKDILIEKQKKLKSDLRAIVFVNQKVSVHIIVYFILSDAVLTAKGFKAVPLYSITTKSPTSSLSLTKTQSKINLNEFRKGIANVLVCTTVAEEGIDVAAANCVIRFDSVLNSVSFVQGRGRARQKDSSFVIMSEEKERTVDKLEKIEKLQADIAAKFEKFDCDSKEFQKKQRMAQRSREQNAKKKVLLKWKNCKNKSLVLSMINQFCKSTKVVLMESYLSSKNGYVCNLEYRSCLRIAKCKGIGSNKKNAKKEAASNMLDVLSQQI
eukprot:312186_1